LDDPHYSEFETIDYYSMKNSSPQLWEDDEDDSRFYNDSERNMDKIWVQSSVDRETCVDEFMNPWFQSPPLCFLIFQRLRTGKINMRIKKKKTEKEKVGWAFCTIG